MSSKATNEVLEPLVKFYLSDGNAVMGAAALNEFAAEDMDLLINREDVPSSVLAAGSKAYLAGVLFGAHTMFKELTGNHESVDYTEIVRANGPGVERSLADGLDDVKRDVLSTLEETDRADAPSDGIHDATE